MIPFDPSGRFVLVPDLGLDRVFVYRLNTGAGTLVANDPPAGQSRPGAGPRHLHFHPSGRWVYVIDEMGNTVSVFAWDGGRGALEPVQTVPTLPAGFTGSSTAAQIVVSPSGQFAYGSNRGHDSIAVYAVDEASGRLTPVGHEPTRGKTPRNFNVDPTGSFLLAANQDSDTVAVFRIDQATGRLTPIGEPVAAGSPSCVLFLSS
jgi:6-phosphogluconolactonase